MKFSPNYFWLASTRGPLRVEYAQACGALMLNASGFSLECGTTVNWRDLVPADRAAVVKRLAEYRAGDL